MNKKSAQITLLLLLFTNVTIYSQGLSEIDSITIQNNKLTILSGNDELIFEACKSNIIRVNYLPDRDESPNTPVTADSIWNFNSVSFDTSGNPIIISTSDLTFEIERNPVRFSAYSSVNGLLFSEQAEEGINKDGIKLNSSHNNYYGVDNRDNGNLTSNEGGYVSAGLQGDAGAPFIWTNNGFGILADSDGGTFDVRSNQLEFYTGNNPKLDVEIFFIFGSPKQIFKGLHAITGKPPLFPKFSFGFMNTEWGMDEDELRTDVQTYREKNIPIDAYILDFDWMAWGEDNYGEFRWGNKFPNGSNYQLKEDMDSLGLKMFGIRKPRIHVNTVQGTFCEDNDYFMGYETDYFSGEQVGLLDFGKEEVRDWYWESFAISNNSYNKGIIGFWNDEADQYGGNFNFLQMQQSMYEGQREFNNQRVWSINRNFYSGSQRYAYGLWSGDISTGFASMAKQRLFMLTSVVLGGSWWGMDIGGFHGTPSPENYYRWIQFGAFIPIFRVHGTYGEEREPWNYGSKAERISKKYITLRYKMMPYIYSEARKNHETGIPMVKPLVMDFPNDPNVKNIYSEWMFGDDILVNPIVHPGIEDVEVYFPEGIWIDYFKGKFQYGSSFASVEVTDEDIPVFIKAGSIIPTAPVGDYVDDPSTESLVTLEVFPDGSDSTMLYEDDGRTYDYEDGEYAKTYLFHESSDSYEYVNISNKFGNYDTPERDYIVKMNFVKDGADSVLLDENQLSKYDLNQLIESSVTGWAYDSAGSVCYARFNDDGLQHSIKYFLKKDEEPPAVDSAYINLKSEIIVYFNERVQTGESEYSAENVNNYSINGGLEIKNISANNSKDQVKIKLIGEVTESNYTLTIAKIGDLSGQNNIMSPTEITLVNSKPSNYTITFQDGIEGYTGTEDSHIAENFPDNNMGSNPTFEMCRYAGDNAGDDKSAIVKFDLTAIENIKDSITSAELLVTFAGTRNGSSPKDVSAHQVTKDWEEGDIAAGIDGSGAETNQVTWRSARHNIELWDNPGGDFKEEKLDEREIRYTPGTVYSWDIKGAVEVWLESGNNYGVILREENPASLHGTKVFYSSESEQFVLRPKLKINFKRTTTDISGKENDLPMQYSLQQNFPNPFNPSTTIRYTLPQNSFVKLKVYNVIGQLVETLVDREQKAGRYSVDWNAGKYSSGVYLYRLETTDFVETQKLLLLK